MEVAQEHSHRAGRGMLATAVIIRGFRAIIDLTLG